LSYSSLSYFTSNSHHLVSWAVVTFLEISTQEEKPAKLPPEMPREGSISKITEQLSNIPRHL
jgi:hypothetical protein